MLYSHYVSELLTGVTEKAAAASYKVNLVLLPSGIAVQFSGYSDPDVVRRFMDDVLQGECVGGGGGALRLVLCTSYMQCGRVPLLICLWCVHA